jgi:hypothetical protein
MRRSDVPLCIFVCVDELARDEFCPFGTTRIYSYRRTKEKVPHDEKKHNSTDARP